MTETTVQREDTLVVHDREGLWVPMQYRDASGVTVRTPEATHVIHPGEELGPYISMVRPREFGEASETAMNPELAPDKVSILEFGGTPDVYTVEVDA